jgi:curved DNA-binding protein CbpA
VQQTTKDLYKVLGLSSGASPEDIRKAHRKLVRQYHPDANPGDTQAEERFKEVQRAYEVLSNPEKRQEYDKQFHTSTRERSSGRPRPGAGRRAGGGTTHTVDLSELLAKLANLSSDGAGGRKEGSWKLQGEEVANIAKLLGEKISRISELLGKDPARISKLLSDNVKMDAKVSFGDARFSRFSSIDEDVSGGNSSGIGGRTREKRVKGPRAQGREKRVKGPRAQGREKRVKGPRAQRKRKSD